MNFSVYRSSAGSGKTYTLVREYLVIALDDKADPPQQYKEILAVTFTNKAAAEMKERVIRYLEDLTHLRDEHPDEFAATIMKKLNIDRLTLVSRAKSVLKAILHNYSDFAVGTIDAFVQKIVRAFAFDLQLPVNFEIETDEKRLIREAVDILISRIGDDKELTDLLIRFSEAQTEDEKSWQLEENIQKISANLLREEEGNAARSLKELSIGDFILIREKLYTSNKKFESAIKKICVDLKTEFDRQGVDFLDLANGNKGVGIKFKKFAEGDLDKLLDFEDRFNSFLNTKNPFLGKLSKEDQQKIIGLKPVIGKAGEELISLIREESDNYLIRHEVLKNLFALSVLNQVESIIDEFKEKDHIVHISVFNRLIADVVSREPVPFIYERLGEKFKNYLIDEFQDTSAVQWQNFLPLIDNALASAHFSMLVGDGKQAIYRWRGGDVKQFTALPNLPNPSDNPLVNERVQSLIRNFREEALDTNFRSLANIIQFNNEFFERASMHLEDIHKAVYKGVAQKTKPGNEGGLVTIAQMSEEQSGEQEALRLVQEALSFGWQPSDIAIITRTNDEVNLIATTLLAAKIPVLASESLYLRNAPEVEFLVSVLRCIDFPEDVIAATSAIHFMCASGIITEDLHETLSRFRAAKCSLLEFLKTAGFDLYQKNIPAKNIYHRTEEIIRLFGMKEKMSAFTLFFLDEVLAFSALRNSGIDFFSWWEERSKKASIIVPEGMNAVRVMTIHKAKGLEFPVVIIPFADWFVKTALKPKWIDYDDELVPNLKKVLITPVTDLNGTKFQVYRDEELSKQRLDLLNELYVAFTRAVAELHIVIPAFKSSADSKMQKVQEFVLDHLNNKHLAFSEGLISIGERGKVIPQKNKSTDRILLQITRGDDWENRLMLRAASKEIWPEEKEKAKQKGNLLHKLLSQISKVDDIDPTINAAVDSGMMNEAERNELTAALKKIISDPAIADCFSKGNKLRQEKEILRKDGTVLRPDLVIEGRDELIILDYKTGKKENYHRKQLDLYAETLHEMGYRNIRKKLFYTETLETEDWN